MVKTKGKTSRIVESTPVSPTSHRSPYVPILKKTVHA